MPRPAPRAATRTVSRALGVSLGVHAGLLVALGAVVVPRLGAPQPLSASASLESAHQLEDAPEPPAAPAIPLPPRPEFDAPDEPREPLPESPISFSPAPVTAAPGFVFQPDPGIAPASDSFGGRTPLRVEKRLASGLGPPPCTIETRGADCSGPPVAETDALMRPLALASNGAPAYPRTARRRGWTGTVVLELDLDELGRVIEALVVESSGRAILDQAALKAVREWRYQPARRGDRPVPFTLRQPVTFSLE